MGYLLYREIRDRAPGDWTHAERLVALMIADDANDTTRKSWIKLPELMQRTGIKTESGIRQALQRLASHGYEFRVPIGKGKDGRLVFAAKGHSLDYSVPSMPAKGDSSQSPNEEGTDVPPTAKGDSSQSPSSSKATGASDIGDSSQSPLSSAPLLKDQKMASRQAHASSASARWTDQDKIHGTREAAELVYGTTEMNTITDDELLWLADDKLPKDGRRVGSVEKYMTKIFTDTPCIDTLLAGLDPGDDDYELAAEPGRDQPPPTGGYPVCVRCERNEHSVGATGICSLCEAGIWTNTPTAQGWNQAILNTVKNSIQGRLGKTVNDEWAARVANLILGPAKGRVPHPAAYIKSVIYMDDNPDRFLPTPTPPNSRTA